MRKYYFSREACFICILWNSRRKPNPGVFMSMVPETDFSNLTGNYTWQSTQLTSLRVSVLLLDPSFYLDHTSLVKINPARLLRPILLLFFFLFSAFFLPSLILLLLLLGINALEKMPLQIYKLSFFWWYKRIRILTRYKEAFLWWAIKKLCMKWKFHGERWNNMLSGLLLVCWLPGSPSQGQGCWVPGLSKTLYNLVLLFQ